MSKLYDNVCVGSTVLSAHEASAESRFRLWLDGFGKGTMYLKNANVAYVKGSTVPYRILVVRHDANLPFHIFEDEKLIIVVEDF